MAEVLCGVALLVAGYLLGLRERRKPSGAKMTEEEQREEEQLREQWDKVMNFSGRRREHDE